jgi:hypothetical protein
VLSPAQLREVTWKQGIDTVYGTTQDREVFVTPSVDGWVFVVGWWVMGSDGEAIEALAERLSVCFGEVQAFGTHRVSEAHGWVLAREGRLVRSFCVAMDIGEICADKGELTPVERTFNWGPFLPSFGTGATSSEPGGAGDDEDGVMRFPGEESVMQVAAAWSVDPTTLEGREEPLGPGLLGRVPGKLTADLVRRLAV